MCISNRVVPNKILEFVNFYAIKSNANSGKLLQLIKEVFIKVILCYLLTFTMNIL